MFNKKNDSRKKINNQINNSIPSAPPKMRRHSNMTPLPPKHINNIKHSLLTESNISNDNLTFIDHDITIIGSIVSNGEIIIEGTIEGDVRAQKIIVKNTANITGELISEELIIHGRMNGIVRGIKVLLAADCTLNGDILHQTLAIESGAQFDGSCKRSDNPLADISAKKNKKDKIINRKSLTKENNFLE